MKIKQLIDEDFVNYKLPSMFIGVNSCDFKCCKESNLPIETCQNSELAQSKTIDIDIQKLCDRYIQNDITQAVVFGGLEPLLQLNDIHEFITTLRLDYNCKDDIVIYTGYTYEEREGEDAIGLLSDYSNIVIKFGRYIPGYKPHYDEILGVYLASDNQSAIRF